jgi:hypothetical protein
MKSRTAIGTPVGSLIMLIATVILAATVVLFAVNLTANQVQKEKLYVASSHVWYVDRVNSVAAVGVTNTGPVDAVLTRINVNGLDCQWNGERNYVIYASINGTIPGDLAYADISGGNTTLTIAGAPHEFTTASEGLTLKAGSSIAFYIAVPNNIMIYDLAQPIRMVITTSQSVYCIETNVQSAT